MCGIFVSVHTRVAQEQDSCGSLDLTSFSALAEDLRTYNAMRGPDYQGRTNVVLPRETLSGELVASFYGSELRLRGHSAIQQPHQKNGNILCWNGEVFNGLEISAEENDGVKLMDELGRCENETQISDLFGSIEGPYGFAYYHSASQRLYFARDPLGRRSLLIHKPTAMLPCFILSSVSSGSNALLDFEEVTTDYIFCLDLSRLRNIADWTRMDEMVTQIPREGLRTKPLPYAHPATVNTTLPPSDVPLLASLTEIPDHLNDAVNDFLELLDQNVARCVRDIPQTSAGPGAARLSILFSGGIDSTALTYLAHRHIPINEPIDLLNVAFENPRKIRIAGEGNMGGLPKRKKAKDWKEKQNAPSGAKVSYTVPDRKTGLQELEELRRLCPGRTWNFVEVNVSYEETQSAKEKIQNLMLPSRTVMDLSLALALYFASRGKGIVRKDAASDAVAYTSPARVVLSGLGSDELLGGYGRHRTAFTNAGWQGVIDELQLEVDRLPQRNLGRDDRIISAHGKETRHPFLSLDVVSFLAKLPVHYKLDPRLEVGKGDKTLLRLVTMKLGLVEASCRKKRAMQFGSHSARMDGERRGDVDLE